MDNPLVFSHNNLCKEIKSKLSSQSSLKDATDTFKEWIRGKRKWEQVRSINDLISLLVRAGLFGIYQINSILTFKKLVNDIEFDAMVTQYLKLLTQYPDNKVPVNQYALARLSESKVPITKTVPARGDDKIPESSRIEIISLIMKQITEYKSLGRHLGFSTAELDRIKLMNVLPTARCQLVMEKYCAEKENSLSTLIKVLNEDLKRKDVTKLIEELLM